MKQENEKKEDKSGSSVESSIDNKKTSTKEQKIFKDKDAEIEKLRFDNEHWKNEYYKAYADMANLRKSMEKDQKDVYKYRIEGFAQSLLGVLDAFDMAFKNEPTTPELKNYLTGFQYVHNQLLSILKEEGIEEICPKIGDKFDEKDMHAIETIETDGEINLIHEITLKGYRLYDHLIRPAMVVVTTAKKETDDVVEEKKDEK